MEGAGESETEENPNNRKQTRRREPQNTAAQLTDAGRERPQPVEENRAKKEEKDELLQALSGINISGINLPTQYSALVLEICF